MRQLLPDACDVDPPLVHATVPRPAPAGRPWVMVNMVASVDGATAVEGRSGALGSSADREVFGALRAAADVVLAGAATVNAERYRPPQTPGDVQETRRLRGQRPKPRIAVVSGQLSVDPTLELFADPAERPIIITTVDADTERRSRLEPLADVIAVGEGRVDLGAALAALSPVGSLVLCEGGPTLNGQLLENDLVDEVNLSISPVLTSGSARRLAMGRVSLERHLTMAHLWTADDMLLARYLVERDQQRYQEPG